jgi:hypothetical protein
VTRIELQAVGGAVLAAIGLWYDDYQAGDPNPVTNQLLGVLTYTTGVESNDEVFTGTFPYVAAPHSGTSECGGAVFVGTNDIFGGALGLSPKPVLMKNYPNPFLDQTTFQFKVNQPIKATLRIYNAQGSYVATAFTGNLTEGDFNHTWNSAGLPAGLYIANLYDANGNLLQSGKLMKTE